MQYIDKRAPQEDEGGYSTGTTTTNTGNQDGTVDINIDGQEGQVEDSAVTTTSGIVSEIDTASTTLSSVTTTRTGSAATITTQSTTSALQSASSFSSLPITAPIPSGIPSVLSSTMSQPSSSLPLRSSLTIIPSASAKPPVLPSSGSTVYSPNNLLLLSIMMILFVRLFIKN
jgi:hypothetical protein